MIWDATTALFRAVSFLAKLANNTYAVYQEVVKAYDSDIQPVMKLLGSAKDAMANVKECINSQTSGKVNPKFINSGECKQIADFMEIIQLNIEQMMQVYEQRERTMSPQLQKFINMLNKALEDVAVLIAKCVIPAKSSELEIIWWSLKKSVKGSQKILFRFEEIHRRIDRVVNHMQLALKLDEMEYQTVQDTSFRFDAALAAAENRAALMELQSSYLRGDTLNKEERQALADETQTVIESIEVNPREHAIRMKMEMEGSSPKKRSQFKAMLAEHQARLNNAASSPTSKSSWKYSFSLISSESLVIETGEDKFPIILGNGATGNVFKGRWKQPNGKEELVAFKEFNLMAASSSAEAFKQLQRTLKREAELMWRLNGHVSAVQLRGAVIEDKQNGLVFELCDGGTLESHLYSFNKQSETFIPSERPLSLSDKVICISDVLSALAFSHREHLVHRDLKSANVLLQNYGSDSNTPIYGFKLSDFGSARAMANFNADERSAFNSSVNTAQTNGTVRWSAPELIFYRKKVTPEERKLVENSFAVDIYAFGLLVCEIFLEQPPFANHSPGLESDWAIKQDIHEGKVSPYEAAALATLPASVQTMIQMCTARDPQERPTVQVLTNQLWARCVAELCPKPAIEAPLNAAEYAPVFHKSSSTSTSSSSISEEQIFHEKLWLNASEGDVASQYQLARAFEVGNGITKEFHKAKYWYEHAIQRNSAAAMVCLGNMYASGDGVEGSEEKAQRLYQQAADQIDQLIHEADNGDSEMQLQLAHLFLNIRGELHSNSDGLRYLQQSAALGNIHAQVEMGNLYQIGKAVPQSDEKSLEWYRKAAERGSSTAQFYINLYEKTNSKKPRVDVDLRSPTSPAREQSSPSAATNFCEAQLTAAILEVNESQLETGIQLSQTLNMDPTQFQVVAEAQNLVKEIRQCRSLISTAFTMKGVSYFESAVQRAEEMGYQSILVTEARKRLQRLHKLHRDARSALHSMNTESMSSVVSEADELQASNDDVVKIRSLLDLPPARLMSMELDEALRKKDCIRYIRASLKSSDYAYLHSTDELRKLYELHHFPGLRSHDEWADSKSVFDNLASFGKMEGMLTYSSKRLHSPLTSEALENDPSGTLSRKAFDCIRRFSGALVDSPPLPTHEAQLQSVQELLEIGSKGQWATAEVFCQLLKQLRGNPNLDSDRLIWWLVGICVQVLPVPDSLFLYAEAFLRSHASAAMQLRLRVSMYATVFSSTYTSDANKSMHIPCAKAIQLACRAVSAQTIMSIKQQIDHPSTEIDELLKPFAIVQPGEACDTPTASSRPAVPPRPSRPSLSSGFFKSSGASSPSEQASRSSFSMPEQPGMEPSSPKTPNMASPNNNRKVMSSVLSVACNMRHVICGNHDGSVSIWDIYNGERISFERAHTSKVTCVCIHPNDRLYASASWDHTIIVWNLISGRQQQVLKSSKDSSGIINAWNCISFGRQINSNRLISCSQDQKVVIWNIDNGESVKKLKQSDKITCCTPSLDGKHILTGSWDTTVVVWSAAESVFSKESGRQLAVLKKHNGWVTCLAISPDNQFVASGSNDKSIVLWVNGLNVPQPNAFSLQMLFENHPQLHLKGHNQSVNSVCFTPDNRFLVSASEDNTVNIWAVSRFSYQLLVIINLLTPVNSVSVTPDSRFIIAGCANNTISVIDIASRSILRTFAAVDGSSSSSSVPSKD